MNWRSAGALSIASCTRFRSEHAAQRQIPARHPFGERDEVRLDPPMAERKPFSGAAKAGDHLVGDQQDLVAVADLAQPREIARRRHDDPARPHDRLGDDRRDGVGPSARIACSTASAAPIPGSSLPVQR